MNSTLKYLSKRFDINFNQSSPITVEGFSRNGLSRILRELNFTVGAEIGTEHGRYAQILCGHNPRLKLYCIDSWTAVSYYEGFARQEDMDKNYEIAKERLAKYNCEIIKKTSMEAVKNFEPNTLDFVFIDGNHHFEFVVNDIIHWSRIVKPGGIVYGHDYSDQFHVKYAVKAFMDASNINPWFILHKDKLIDSWMYVRQEEDGIFYT